jgi:hypothetical protein
VKPEAASGIHLAFGLARPLAEFRKRTSNSCLRGDKSSHHSNDPKKTLAPLTHEPSSRIPVGPTLS